MSILFSHHRRIVTFPSIATSVTTTTPYQYSHSFQCQRHIHTHRVHNNRFFTSTSDNSSSSTSDQPPQPHPPPHRKKHHKKFSSHREGSRGTVGWHTVRGDTIKHIEAHERLRKLQLYKQLLPIRSAIQLQLSEHIKQQQKQPHSIQEQGVPYIKAIPTPTPTTIAMTDIQKPSTTAQERPIIIDGNATAKRVREQLRQEVDVLKTKNPSLSAPTLAVVLVGSRKDSQTYVKMKTKACSEVGILTEQYDLEESTTQDELESLVKKLNENHRVNGILIQLPLPAHIKQDRVIQLIDTKKDADGLTLVSAGQVFSYGLGADLIACTPLGCITLLDAYNVPIKGKHAVVLGRSQLVGKPIASLLLSRDATVTMCHSKTSNLPDIVRQADILIAAIGKPKFVKSDWLKPDVVVIDVGINAVDDSTDKRGYKLVGDVDYETCKDVASAITPVPGGVGPMTVAMLLRNTIKAHYIQNQEAIDGGCKHDQKQ